MSLREEDFRHLFENACNDKPANSLTFEQFQALLSRLPRVQTAIVRDLSDATGANVKQKMFPKLPQEDEAAYEKRLLAVSWPKIWRKCANICAAACEGVSGGSANEHLGASGGSDGLDMTSPATDIAPELQANSEMTNGLVTLENNEMLHENNENESDITELRDQQQAKTVKSSSKRETNPNEVVPLFDDQDGQHEDEADEPYRFDSDSDEEIRIETADEEDSAAIMKGGVGAGKENVSLAKVLGELLLGMDLNNIPPEFSDPSTLYSTTKTSKKVKESKLVGGYAASEISDLSSLEKLARR
jgi:hypothetical protein